MYVYTHLNTHISIRISIVDYYINTNYDMQNEKDYS